VSALRYIKKNKNKKGSLQILVGREKRVVTEILNLV